MRTDMRRGLIGHTGFVGSNLDRLASFDERYNSRNSRDMCGKTFDLLVCAGVRAEKWIANKNPEEDESRIGELTDVLETVDAREFVLVSTIDVYPNPTSGDDEGKAIDPTGLHTYGRNRFSLEQWVQQRYACARIVRLPALFGQGLKKNAIFDLLHDNQVDDINPAASFQWYPIDRLWDDIEIIRECNLSVVNLFTEPLGMQRIIDSYFPGAPVGPAQTPAPAYCLRTRYAEEFGGCGGYIMDAESCFEAIGEYVGSERRKGVTANDSSYAAKD